MSYKNQYTTYIDNILYNIDDILYNVYILKSQICIYIYLNTLMYIIHYIALVL